MKIILIQNSLNTEEVNQLTHEFPDCLFLCTTHDEYEKFDEDHWSQVEVLFGKQLKTTYLKLAKNLKWIHIPSDSLNHHCLKIVEKNPSTILTTTEGDNSQEVAEFVLGSILLFAKQLLRVTQNNDTPSSLWKKEHKWENNNWTLKGRRLLQVGLSKTGSEIARQAKNLEMRVWGVSKTETFNRYCTKTYNINELNSLLPAADCVVIDTKELVRENMEFKVETLLLMREESILILLGCDPLIDTKLLAKICENKRFRGVLIDAEEKSSITHDSPLWKSPYVLITPHFSSFQTVIRKKKAFSLFRHNLRHFLKERYDEMENIYQNR